MKITRALVIIFLCGTGCAFGQADKIDTVLQTYRQNYPPEKVYIQFDKSVYRGGDTVWFKAYLQCDVALRYMSKSLYVDFYGVDGRLLKHLVTPVFAFSAWGQVGIPSTYPGSFIHVKAYTRWMLNFDSAFLYTKDIYISQADKAKKTTVRASASPAASSLHFFPEGGDWIAGINTKVAFLATGPDGRPVNAVGSIVNSKGEFVDSFSTQHDGMGSMMLIAMPDESYTADWQDANGDKHRTPLPQPAKEGIAMRVQPLSNQANVFVSRTAGAGDDAKTLHLVAVINHQLVYRARLNLSARQGAVAEIPTGSLPPGIMQITVFNNRLLPVGERIVFVNNHNYTFTTDVFVQEKNLAQRGKNVIEIAAPDTIPINVSVSITDAGLYTEKNNIFSQLLLCDDIRGFINDPSYYFDNEADSTKRHLDLVMLTHGWRRFNWGAALNGRLPELPYGRDSNYLQIKGKAFIPEGLKSQGNQKLFLVLQAKDSTKRLLNVALEKDGSFALNSAIYFDTLKVFYTFAGDKKMERKSELSFQNGFVPSRPAGLPANYSSPYLWPFNDSAEIRGEKYLSDKIAGLEKSMKVATLQDVIVTAKRKSPIDLLDEKYTSGLFTGGDVVRGFDLTNDQRTNGMYSVFQYLQGLIPGLQIVQNNGSWQLSWRGASPALFVDEVGTDARSVDNIPLSDIAYVKVFRPPFFGASTGGNGGAIAIYRRKGADIRSAADDMPGLSFQYLEGYSPFKQFYSPDYAETTLQTPDVRTTLYWAPDIFTDSQKRSYTISFYNNDISKKLRVIVEGVNADGKLTRTEKVIE